MDITAKTARWIFYLGTFSSLVLFLGLTVDTHRQIAALTHVDQLNDTVVAGKRVWHKYNCNDCHTILGFGAYYGPDLTKAYWRRGADGIKAMVRNPERFTTWRKMPRQNLSEPELDQLVAFLQWTSAIENNDWPPQDRKFRSAAGRAVTLGLSPGANLFQEKGCFACHNLNGTGGDAGPELTHAGARLDYDRIARLLNDPLSVNPNAIMPAPALSPEERQKLAQFLADLK